MKAIKHFILVVKSSFKQLKKNYLIRQYPYYGIWFDKNSLKNF